MEDVAFGNVAADGKPELILTRLSGERVAPSGVEY
jgi:hypothetical protein